ncbi:hypothetical protein M2444_004596 [Paenibacillus sp. PastF-3]|nr:hypothetical protein [Paenibacillus sp. PastF-3]
MPGNDMESTQKKSVGFVVGRLQCNADVVEPM